MFVVLCALANLESPLMAATCTAPTPGSSPPAVLTAQYDIARDGYNSNESVLTASALAAKTEGLCQPSWSPLVVDTPSSSLNVGSNNPIYAQPLYVPGIHLSGNHNCGSEPSYTCNMIVFPTLYDSVWAYNADTGGFLWSRTGLWTDCGQTNTQVAFNAQLNGGQADGVGSVYPFAGIVSTPVIDTTLATPAMFLTSLCQTQQGPGFSQWWLHELNLTNGSDIGTPVQLAGSVTGSGDADDYSQTTGRISFQPNEVLQRSALLEVSNANSTTSPLIYFTFGSAVPEAYNPYAGGGTNVKPYPYHGWVFAATIGSGQQLSIPTGFPFATSPAGPTSNTGTPPCAVCPACASGCSSVPTTCVPANYENSPNWCGHGGGSWGGASRGPAAATLGSGSSAVTHAFVGVGNGPFQMQCNQQGCTGPLNFGQSILDFQLPTTTLGLPSAFFAPYGGGSNVLQSALLGGPTCPNETSGNCQYLTEVQSENDWDMSQSGNLLFTANSNNWLVAVDKAGYGYPLHQRNLGGWASGDPGNVFPFGAANSLCGFDPITPSNSCDRVTSLAYYNNTLFFWPNNELMTAFQFSNNSAQPGSGNLWTTGTSSPYTNVDLATANQVIAGDQITVTGATPATQTVMTVNSTNTQLTVSPGFNSAVSATTNWTYNGYFIKPHFDNLPQSGGGVQYPGGTVEVSSNGGTDGVAWGLALIQTQAANPPSRTYPICTAMLNGYDATSTDSSFMDLVWSSWNSTNGCNGSCFNVVPQTIPGVGNPQTGPGGCANTAATFALPTIANGNIYIPTWSVSGPVTNGVVVFVHNP